ncbi:MAG TPA: hypothetical protein VFG44_06050, partial [Burkholderiales bacterium]|nr:hypothetical protein [Burkholderiales bacterium]
MLLMLQSAGIEGAHRIRRGVATPKSDYRAVVLASGALIRCGSLEVGIRIFAREYRYQGIERQSPGGPMQLVPIFPQV